MKYQELKDDVSVCRECGAADVGTKTMTDSEGSVEVCALCEAENSVRAVQFSEWMEDMAANDDSGDEE